MKRFRRPKIKDGQLMAYWGKLPGDSPDVVYLWQGEGTSKNDARLLHYHLYCQQPDPHVTPLFSKMRPSLIEELDSRGYDITTLRFTIMKRQAPEQS